MIGQDHGPDIDLLQPEPRENEGAWDKALEISNRQVTTPRTCEHNSEPEGGRDLQSMAERFSRSLVVVGEQDDLSPDHSGGRPPRETMNPSGNDRSQETVTALSLIHLLEGIVPL